MIINLRGTSGSGKTTVIRELMQLYTPVSVIERTETGCPLVYQLSGSISPVYVLGSYENVCGGCDVVENYTVVIPQLIAKYMVSGHVLFEGLLVSGAFGATGACLSKLAKGVCVVVAFLDTPLSICLDRVKNRRVQRGAQKVFNPANTIQKFNQIVAVKRMFRGTDVRVVDVDHREALQHIVQLLEENR